MNAPPLHERLFAANAQLYDECCDGPFITALADGSLPADAFRNYLSQDVLFIRDFLAATAEAIKGCVAQPDLVSGLAELLVGGIGELESVERDAIAYGVDLNSLTRSPATVAFGGSLLATAQSKRPDVCVAGLSPCLELYSYIGRIAVQRGRITTREPAYRKWFEKYASQDMQDLARIWQGYLDRFGNDG